MKQHLTFEIKEPDTPSYTLEVSIQLPDNWHTMTKDEQRELLVKPSGSHMHPGQILYYSSPFQKAVGVDEVEDFDFWVSEERE